MQKFNGSLIRQFPSLVTGNAATGVNVSVYIAGTTTLATLYATDNVAGATLANPLTTDSKGFYSFYAADGKYTLSYSNGFPSQDVQLVDVDAIRNDFDALEVSNETFKTQQQAAYDNFVLSQGWDQVGTFAAGFTFESPNQVGQDADGNWWRWNGAFPKVVTAGTNPSSDSNYKLVGDGVLRSDLAAADSAVQFGGSTVGVVAERAINSLQVGLVQGAQAPAYNIQLIDHVGESTDRRIIAIIDDVLYADSSTALYQSLDMGETWTSVRTKSGRWLKMLKCDDGEILIITGGDTVQKSSGWAANRATATFSVVLSFPALTGVLRWGIDGNGTKFIVTHYENGGTRADVRYAYISTDGGDTWALVWDSVVRFGATDADGSHLHAVCYDKRNDRFWICEGHLDLGVFYSDDNGGTWTRLAAGGQYTQSTPTTLTATPYGIVVGTDQFPNGVHLIKGDVASTLRVEVAYVYRNQTAGTTLQADAAVIDPDTGMVYIAARGFAGTAKAVIMASNGETASIIYESDVADAIFNLAVKDGKLIAHQSGTPFRTIKGRVSVIGSKQPLIDAGNFVTDNIVPNLSMALGKGASAKGLNAIAIGRNSSAGAVGGDDHLAIGSGAVIESGQNNIAVGAANTMTGTTTTSVSIGADITLNNLSAATVVGNAASATASNTAVYGEQATAGGSNSTAVGRLANANAGNATAIGNQSTAALSSVSVGSSSSANVTGGVAVGYLASANSNNAVAVGESAAASGSSVAVGKSSAASGGSSTALGQGAASSGAQSVAVGQGVQARSTNCTAVGYQAQTATSITNATAIGGGSSAAHANSVALGQAAATVRADSVCVGNRDIESTRTAGRVILKSPDGTLYALAVANGGTLTITAV